MRRIESVNKNGKWKPNGKSLDLHECPEWFKDAKFGIFVDWGLWSLASWGPKSRKGAMYPDWYELRMCIATLTQIPLSGATAAIM